MASEKTEEATPRRRNKAREEGQISKSQDLNSALTLSANFAILFVLSPMIVQQLINILKYALSNLQPEKIGTSIIYIMVPYVESIGIALFPFFMLSIISSILILRMMSGPLFTLNAIQPKLDKLSPFKLLNNLKSKFFSIKQLVELAKSVVKLLIVSGVGYSVFVSKLPDLANLLGVPIQAAFATIMGVLTQMIINMCIAMIILGLIDKKYQDYEYNKSLKMTKHEVEDERKSSDGDPKIKQKIKSAQMQMMRQKMMQQVKTADVVVTNPTHYAVAIRYNTDIAPAPQVVAKGVDFMAFKIREIAEEYKIPIKENKPLARTLYKVVPLEGIIPPELYVAVAELLAFVYNQGRRR